MSKQGDDNRNELSRMADEHAQATVAGLNMWVVLEDIARQLASHIDLSIGEARKDGSIFRKALEQQVTGQLNRVDKNGKQPVFEECQTEARKIVDDFVSGLNTNSIE